MSAAVDDGDVSVLPVSPTSAFSVETQKTVDTEWSQTASSGSAVLAIRDRTAPRSAGNLLFGGQNDVASQGPRSFSTILRSFSSLTRDEQDLMMSPSVARCVNRGMQVKCHIKGLAVRGNTFSIFGDSALRNDGMPNPIFPPDGQKGPLVQYHKYKGHPIRVLRVPQEGSDHNAHCAAYVTRPTVFLYRMSGHSTYHLWENNLGPFFATLNDRFGFSGGAAEELRTRLLDPSRLVVSFVDDKPSKGPKAPLLLNRLLRLFSDVSLVNASAIGAPERGEGEPPGHVCFTEAIVGISSNSFPHRGLLYRMMESVAGYSPPSPLPFFPSILFISRNHHSVVRGRKIANEQEAVSALNASLYSAYEAAVGSWRGPKAPYSFRVVHMEDFAFEDQIRLSMRTQLIFSPHGGGVTNCIWMREGSVIVEFVAPVGRTLTNMYHSLCGKSGVTHFHFLADPDPADNGADLGGNPRLFSNMVVPPEKITQSAEKALRHYGENYEKYARSR